MQQITEDVTVPMLNAIIRPIINPIGNMIIKNAELDREFRPKYKRPAECEEARDMETVQKCSDHYRNARAEFAKHKEIIKISNENEILRLHKQIEATKAKQEAVKQAKEEARQTKKGTMKITRIPTEPEQYQNQIFKDQYKRQPECFEKSTNKKVNCGNDYIKRKSSFCHIKQVVIFLVQYKPDCKNEVVE
jgi:hypothetical protein